ncbi:MAG: hypothetical protein EPO21_15150 [Chloroflexota bacterium]|nr:MAG: hypothetical protein EPO21_15150 [Chloroflexota bacterium]
MAREQALDVRDTPSVWGCLRSIVLVFLFFIFLVVAGLVYIGLRSESLVEEMPATLHAINGTAQIQRSGTSEWTPATDLWPLAPGDTVRVGEDASILLYLFDGSQVHLGAGAQFSLRTSVRNLDRPPLLSPILRQVFPDYPAALETRTQATVVGTLQAGSAIVYAGRPSSSGSYFRLDTPSTTLQGGATIYSVSIDREGATEVESLDGAVLVAALAQSPNESRGIAVSFLQPGRSIHVPPLPAGSETSESAAQQRGAAWTVLGSTASSGVLPAYVEGLATIPDTEDDSIMAYRLVPTPTPVLTVGSEPPSDGGLLRVQRATNAAAPNEEQPGEVLPPDLRVTTIDNVDAKLADAQALLHPRGLATSRLSERDLGARLPGGVALRIQGGGVITARMQGISYTMTIGASRGELTMGGLPPGVSVPDLPASIVSATSEPGQLTIVYKEPK